MSAAGAPPRMGFKEVLRIDAVRKMWIAQLISVFGDFLAVFAVFSDASFRLKAGPAEVSGVMISYLLPFAFVGPFAGVLVDRMDRKRIMIASDLIRACLTLLLPFTTSLHQVYGIFLCLSVVSAFFAPAQSATIRSLVPREGLMTATALLTQAFQAMQIISPFIAGTLVAWAGANACYYTDTLSFVASALMLWTIPLARTGDGEQKSVALLWADLKAGLRFIFTHTAVSFVILAMSAGMFAVRGFGALTAVYVRDILQAGSALFGTLSTLVGVGMITGTQVVHRVAARRPKKDLVVLGLFFLACFVALLAVGSTVTGAVIGMFGMGFGVAFILLPSQTLVQEETPMPMMGRVSSSMMSVIMLSQVASMTFAGGVAEVAGVRKMCYASAVFLLVVTVIAFVANRRGGHPATAAG